jgi:hypothetical protein
LVIFIDNSWTSRGKSELAEYRTYVATYFSSVNGGKELSFGGASGDDGLSFHSVGDGGTSHDKGITGSRGLVSQVVGMGCIDDSKGLREGRVFGVDREVIREKGSRDGIKGNLG